MNLLNTTFIITMFLSIMSYAQNTSIYFHQETGTLNGFIHRANQSVVNINSSGEVQEILVFGSESEAETYIKNPREIFKPLKKIDIGGIDVYLDNYFSTKYYTPNEYHSGMIKEINGLLITYFNPNEYNSDKLKSIGNLTVNYFTPNEYHTGKIKNIGGINIAYYTPTEYNSGKMKLIGDISITYYTPSEYNSGKVKNIGDLTIKYYTPNEYNSGQFKEIQGEDNSFFLR